MSMRRYEQKVIVDSICDAISTIDITLLKPLFLSFAKFCPHLTIYLYYQLCRLYHTDPEVFTPWLEFFISQYGCDAPYTKYATLFVELLMSNYNENSCKLCFKILEGSKDSLSPKFSKLYDLLQIVFNTKVLNSTYEYDSAIHEAEKLLASHEDSFSSHRKRKRFTLCKSDHWRLLPIGSLLSDLQPSMMMSKVGSEKHVSSADSTQRLCDIPFDGSGVPPVLHDESGVPPVLHDEASDITSELLTEHPNEEGTELSSSTTSTSPNSTYYYHSSLVGSISNEKLLCIRKLLKANTE